MAANTDADGGGVSILDAIEAPLSEPSVSQPSPTDDTESDSGSDSESDVELELERRFGPIFTDDDDDDPVFEAEVIDKDFSKKGKEPMRPGTIAEQGLIHGSIDLDQLYLPDPSPKAAQSKAEQIKADEEFARRLEQEEADENLARRFQEQDRARPASHGTASGQASASSLPPSAGRAPPPGRHDHEPAFGQVQRSAGASTLIARQSSTRTTSSTCNSTSFDDEGAESDASDPYDSPLPLRRPDYAAHTSGPPAQGFTAQPSAVPRTHRPPLPPPPQAQPPVRAAGPMLGIPPPHIRCRTGYSGPFPTPTAVLKSNDGEVNNVDQDKGDGKSKTESKNQNLLVDVPKAGPTAESRTMFVTIDTTDW